MVSSFQPGLHPSGTPDSNYAVWSTVYACLRKGCLPGCLTHRRIYSVFCKSKGLERRARAVLNGGSLQVHKPRIAAAERAITVIVTRINMAQHCVRRYMATLRQLTEQNCCERLRAIEDDWMRCRNSTRSYHENFPPHFEGGKSTELWDERVWWVGGYAVRTLSTDDMPILQFPQRARWLSQ